MEKIEIRKTGLAESSLVFIDVDGTTVWAETEKEKLKDYVVRLIDDI